MHKTVLGYLFFYTADGVHVTYREYGVKCPAHLQKLMVEWSFSRASCKASCAFLSVSLSPLPSWLLVATSVSLHSLGGLLLLLLTLEDCCCCCCREGRDSTGGGGGGDHKVNRL